MRYATDRADGVAAQVPVRQRGPWIIVLVALSLGSLVTICLTFAMPDSSARTGGQDVEFGRPLRWIAQNQGESDPPLHTQVAIASPWEHPTHVHFLPAVADVAIFAAPLVIVGALWWIVRRRRST